MAIQIWPPLFSIMPQKFRWWYKFPSPPRTPGAPGTGGYATPVGTEWGSAKKQLRGLASNSKQKRSRVRMCDRTSDVGFQRPSGYLLLLLLCGLWAPAPPPGTWGGHCHCPPPPPLLPDAGGAMPRL
jgi:hypothetical protein